MQSLTASASDAASSVNLDPDPFPKISSSDSLCCMAGNGTHAVDCMAQHLVVSLLDLCPRSVTSSLTPGFGRLGPGSVHSGHAGRGGAGAVAAADVPPGAGGAAAAPPPGRGGPLRLLADWAVPPHRPQRGAPCPSTWSCGWCRDGSQGSRESKTVLGCCLSLRWRGLAGSRPQAAYKVLAW